MSDSNLRDGSGNPITSTASALDVNIKSGASAGGGGTEYADGTTQATPTGTAVLGKNPSNVLKTVSLDASGNVNVNLAAGSISGGNAAASPTAAAVPASADYTGFNSGGNLVGVSSATPLPVDTSQGAPNSVANAWPIKVTNGSNTAAVKASSVAASATDAALVVAVSPNNTVPVSLASLPALVAGSAVIGHVVVDSAPSTPVTNAGTFATQSTLAAETTKVIGTVNVAAAQTIGLAAGAAVIGHVVVDSAPTTAVTLATLPALTAGSAVIGHVIVDSAPSTPVTNAGTFATQATLAAETTKVIGTVNVAAAQTIAVTQATPANLQATVTQQSLTKGTQGATGVSTQDLKDAGRSARTIFLDSFAVAATAETLMTMSYSSDNAAVTTGTSYAVTAAKRLRIQSINVGLHTITGNTTAVNVIVRLRVNNGGAALVSSPIQMVIPVQGIAAANQAGIPVDITIPDGWEFVAGAGIGVTVACAGFVITTAAPKVDISIVGYEY